MNDQPLTEVFVSGLFRQFFELLMTGLLVAVVVHSATMLVLIFCLCRETSRAGRKNAGTEERLPLEAGAPVESLNGEHPSRVYAVESEIIHETDRRHQLV